MTEALLLPRRPGNRDSKPTAPIALWEASSGRFDPVLLRRELMLRGWTASDLAHESGISRTTAYKVLAGEGVLDKVAFKVLLALQGCQPRLSLEH